MNKKPLKIRYGMYAFYCKKCGKEIGASSIPFVDNQIDSCEKCRKEEKS